MFAVDDDWRIVLEPDEPTYFLPSLDADDVTSAPLRVEDLDDLAPVSGCSLISSSPERRRLTRDTWPAYDCGMATADVVILTALELEAEPFWQLMSAPTSVSGAHRRYTIGTIGGRQVVIWPIGGMGNPRSAVAAQQAIAVWNPAYILLAGISGGVRRAERNLGDVVVPEQVVGVEAGKRTGDALAIRYEVFRTPRVILAAARAVIEDADKWQSLVHESAPGTRHPVPQVHFGVLLTGEKVIASSDWTAEQVDAWPQAVGVEMESLGVLLASYEAEQAPAAGVVKAVSDWADETKNDGWQRYAASTSAAFVAKLITKLPLRSDRPQPQRVNSPLSTTAPAHLKAGWGRKKVELCRRLSEREEHELADCLEIEPHEKSRFNDKAFCSAVWDWLQQREKLGELPDILADCLNRRDLADLVRDI